MRHDGCPMSDLLAMRKVLDILCVPRHPQKHWFISTGWGMVDCLNEVLLEMTLSLMRLLHHIPSLG